MQLITCKSQLLKKFNFYSSNFFYSISFSCVIIIRHFLFTNHSCICIQSTVSDLALLKLTPEELVNEFIELLFIADYVQFVYLVEESYLK